MHNFLSYKGLDKYFVHPIVFKALLTMKISFFMLLVFVTTVSAESRAQRITLSMKNAKIDRVLAEIKKQSDHRFLYSSEVLQLTELIDVQVKDADLIKVLDEITKGSNLQYRLIAGTVTISVRAKRPVNGNRMLDEEPRQELRVSGVVKDANGNLLSQASIFVKGSTTNGTNTDTDGRFSLLVPRGAVLVVSYIGYKSAEFAATDREPLEITLEDDESELEEVVVTALGISREKRSLSYATQNIDGGQVSQAKETNVINALQGKVAGLVITRNATGPGGESKVLLRGNRSITGNSQPLYVIDGVPLDGGIEMLNSDDVESMTVLKGASAAALYGSQGQNGAIIITTKRGKSGAVSVNYTGGIAFDQAAVLPELQFEYGQGDGGQFVPNSEHSWGPKAEGQEVTLWNGETVPLLGQPDRFKDFFRTGQTNTNTISINGGGEKMQTLFSYGNMQAEGIMRNNDLKRHNIDFKIANDISDKLSFFSKITYIYESVDNRVVPGEGGTYALPSLYRTPTSIPSSAMRDYIYYDELGIEKQNYWKPGSSILLNPYWALNRVLYNQKRDRIIGLISANYKFNEWLSFQLRGSIDKTIGENDHKIYADNYFSQVGSTYNYGKRTTQGNNVDALLSFDKALSSDFHLTANVGGAVQGGRYKGETGNANGLNKPNFFFMKNAVSPNVNNYIGRRPEVQSVYGTATLGFRNYLFLDVTGRNDWSSALPETNQSYFYPSAGLSAILTDMFELPSWINFGKINATYANSGYGGNEYLDQVYYNVGQGGAIITPTIQSLGDYKPEITTSYEVGLDWQFFNNSLGINFTYYDTKTKNQLLLIGVPPATLFNSKYINAGLIQNRGVELLTTFRPIKTGPVTWDGSVNFSKNVNKIIRLTDKVKSAILVDSRAALIRADEGGSFGDMYVKDWERDEQGRRLVDDNGRPILTSGNDVFLGNFNPDFMLGFSNNLHYKGISLGFLVDYRQGGYIVSGGQALMDADGHTKNSLEGRESGLILDAYTLDGNKNTQSIDAQSYWSMIGDRYPTGALYAYSATNVRLREVVLSYALPSSLLSKTKFLKGASISAVGRNLFFFKLDAPIDPEITQGLNGGGIEYAALPSTRNFGFNLMLSF